MRQWALPGVPSIWERGHSYGPLIVKEAKVASELKLWLILGSLDCAVDRFGAQWLIGVEARRSVLPKRGM